MSTPENPIPDLPASAATVVVGLGNNYVQAKAYCLAVQAIRRAVQETDPDQRAVITKMPVGDFTDEIVADLERMDMLPTDHPERIEQGMAIVVKHACKVAAMMLDKRAQELPMN